MEKPKIQDYAIIGDCRSAALVSRNGSIDWLCWPRFDSPSLFGALLDDAAGSWSLAPSAAYRAERRYLENTNIVETRFQTESGSVRLTDWMPVASEGEKGSMLLADHEILRILECERGEVEVEMHFDPRPGYATRPARLRDAGALGLRMETGGGLLLLRTDMPHVPSGGSVHARARLRAGEAFFFSLTFSDEWPAVIPPLGAWTREALARSVSWWREWISCLTYVGPCREAVVRSALLLKLLVYAPSGAVVASPTTSLPERIGGELNWDYRFCWLRDASLTVRALLGLGFHQEAEAFVGWLLHSTRLSQPRLRILYDVHGKRSSKERTLGHLRGYRDSRPVRVGNAAAEQTQLDVFGEVIDAVTHLAERYQSLDRPTRRLLRGLGSYVCRVWRNPDEGFWEFRSGPRENTYSRVLCWTALDRLLQLHDRGLLPEAPVREFEAHRAQIRHEIEERAWNRSLQHYVAELDGEALDASLLLLPWYGFEEAGSERMKRTYARIRERLGAADALLYRYRTGDSPGEGAFGICGFWAVEYLAMGGGSLEEAKEMFERLCAYANDLGLFAEEIDPDTGDLLGNFPQAFTHIGLINAALSLARRIEGREPISRTCRWTGKRS
jgi:GH15 family glucan-1,4-alpha-glucosidase